MIISQKCCLLLLIPLLARSFLGAVCSAKYGCLGHDILLYQTNITVDQTFTVLILYVNGDNYKQIFKWTVTKGVHSSNTVNGYSDRIRVDQYGHFWIHDLQETDEGKYTVKSTIGNVTRNDTVELNVFVAPNTSCKPKIIPGEDALTTFLEQVGCGKPTPTAYWLEHSGILVDGNTIKLTPGQDAGNVYACVNSPALICLKNTRPTDYCTPYKDESNIQEKVTYISSKTTATLVLIIVVLIAIIVGISIALCMNHRRFKGLMTKKETSQNNEEEGNCLEEQHNPNDDESPESDVASDTTKRS